jgi:hypothetical protein
VPSEPHVNVDIPDIVYPAIQEIEALVTEPSVDIVTLPPVGTDNKSHFSKRTKKVGFLNKVYMILSSVQPYLYQFKSL